MNDARKDKSFDIKKATREEFFSELRKKNIDRMRASREEGIQLNLLTTKAFAQAVDLSCAFWGLDKNAFILYCVRCVMKLEIDPRDVGLELFSKQLLEKIVQED